MLKISEIFGPTFQGEGPSMGQRAAFVRLAICNLHCNFCDTPYSWDFPRYDPKVEITERENQSIVEELLALDCSLIVITGGEPLLQSRSLLNLVDSLLWRGKRVEIETNGTRFPLVPKEDGRVRYNISPKLSHAGDPARKRLVLPVLNHWAARADARWKFVVRSSDDYAEVAGLVRGLKIDVSRVWVMPEGQTVEELDASMPAACEIAEWLKCNLTDRLHIRLWGGKRGK